jgi:putative FmdB family regulatory protein
MPTYEFRCANGHTFDQFHKISDAPQTATCSVCGAEAARAISGGAGLVFKGSGFYLTDYGKNAHRTSAPAAGGESKGEGKGDAKSGEAKGGDGGAKAKDGASSGSGNSAGSGGASGGSGPGGSGASKGGGASGGGSA